MTSQITVAAYFFFDGKTHTDSLGTSVTTDWNWAMQQFDRVAAARGSVRSVVVDQAYVFGMGDPAYPPPNTPNATAVRSKMQQCRDSGQFVYGYVSGSGGALPLARPDAPNPDATWWHIPRDTTKWWVPLTGPVTAVTPSRYPGTNGSFPCLKDQIDLWYNLYGDYVDGIYVDVGPLDCLSEQVRNWSNIPQNYADYCAHIHSRTRPGSTETASAYVLAAGYGDVDPNKQDWFKRLPIDEVSVWEQSVKQYLDYFKAVDYCTLNTKGEPSSIDPPQWWDPGAGQRQHREHFINNGVLAYAQDTGKSWDQVLTDLISLAHSRGADTIWITETQSSAQGSVYGFLPPYWDAEVKLCTPAASTPEKAVD